MHHGHTFLWKCGQGEFFCRYLSSQYPLKTCWGCNSKAKFIWVIRLENVFKMSWNRLEKVLETSWGSLKDVLTRPVYVQWKVLKISYRTFKDLLNMSWRRLEKVMKTSLQYVMKTSLRRIWLRQIYLSWSRLPEDVFWRQRWKTCSRRFQDVFTKTNVC